MSPFGHQSSSSSRRRLPSRSVSTGGSVAIRPRSRPHSYTLTHLGNYTSPSPTESGDWLGSDRKTQSHHLGCGTLPDPLALS
ncbi:hypothetical protein CBOM_08032 [Ceraceosorus bombacis]|uniref:Uncharacterized protein n=1 Tax=Ceraceosorus bombacis TaxID=401625 RepID=A0A0P1B9R0_9BASI|nr:hypothetical protein CBOM_08032 [Ceraceosorus bombacis]